jgi:amino acid permease
MLSIGVIVPFSVRIEYIISGSGREKGVFDNEKYEKAGVSSPDSDSLSVKISSDSTHGQAQPRHIQLMVIGRIVGTALYLQIGHGLLNGDQVSLFLCYTIWYVINLGAFKAACFQSDMRA